MKKYTVHIIVVLVLYISYYFYSRTNFNFDEAYHYSITDKQIDEIYKNDSLNKFDPIFMGDYPENIDDKNFIKELEKYGYKKRKIEENNLFELKSLLRFEINPNFFGTVYACAPSYRDIIILKKDNKISGIAKICFECKQHYFVGNSLDDTDFYNYDNFKEFLHNK